MESDIRALSARITRLELLLGRQSERPCVHQATKTALSKLREHVPDEISAAHRAVYLLSGMASRTPREVDIDGTVDALHRLDGLQCAGPPSHAVEPMAVARLELRVAKLANVVRQEERALDRLLTDFDAATARLNIAIVALAERVSVRGS